MSDQPFLTGNHRRPPLPPPSSEERADSYRPPLPQKKNSLFQRPHTDLNLAEPTDAVTTCVLPSQTTDDLRTPNSAAECVFDFQGDASFSLYQAGRPTGGVQGDTISVHDEPYQLVGNVNDPILINHYVVDPFKNEGAQEIQVSSPVHSGMSSQPGAEVYQSVLSAQNLQQNTARSGTGTYYGFQLQSGEQDPDVQVEDTYGNADIIARSAQDSVYQDLPPKLEPRQTKGPRYVNQAVVDAHAQPEIYMNQSIVDAQIEQQPVAVRKVENPYGNAGVNLRQKSEYGYANRRPTESAPFQQPLAVEIFPIVDETLEQVIDEQLTKIFARLNNMDIPLKDALEEINTLTRQYKDFWQIFVHDSSSAQIVFECLQQGCSLPPLNAVERAAQLSNGFELVGSILTSISQQLLLANGHTEFKKAIAIFYRADGLATKRFAEALLGSSNPSLPCLSLLVKNRPDFWQIFGSDQLVFAHRLLDFIRQARTEQDLSVVVEMIQAIADQLTRTALQLKPFSPSPCIALDEQTVNIWSQAVYFFQHSGLYLVREIAGQLLNPLSEMSKSQLLVLAEQRARCGGEVLSVLASATQDTLATRTSNVRIQLASLAQQLSRRKLLNSLLGLRINPNASLLELCMQTCVLNPTRSSTQKLITAVAALMRSCPELVLAMRKGEYPLIINLLEHLTERPSNSRWKPADHMHQMTVREKQAVLLAMEVYRQQQARATEVESDL